MRRGTLALALAGTLLLAPVARAATVSVSVGTGEEGDAVEFGLSAAPGEANRVTVTTRPPSGKQRIVVFRDAGAPLSAGDGCQAGAAGEVVCRNPLGDFANSVDVIAKDGDDTVDASAVKLRGFTVFIDGGAGSDLLIGSRSVPNALFGDFVSNEVGDDQVTGGRRDDFLQGGPGDDVLDGRGGSDEATYRDERRRVRADLAAGMALTVAGERGPGEAGSRGGVRLARRDRLGGRLRAPRRVRTPRRLGRDQPEGEHRSERGHAGRQPHAVGERMDEGVVGGVHDLRRQ